MFPPLDLSPSNASTGGDRGKSSRSSTYVPSVLGQAQPGSAGGNSKTELLPAGRRCASLLPQRSLWIQPKEASLAPEDGHAHPGKLPPPPSPALRTRGGPGQQCLLLSRPPCRGAAGPGTHHASGQRHAVLVPLIWVQHAQLDRELPVRIGDDGEGEFLLGLFSVVRVDVLQRQNHQHAHAPCCGYRRGRQRPGRQTPTQTFCVGQGPAERPHRNVFGSHATGACDLLGPKVSG